MSASIARRESPRGPGFRLSDQQFGAVVSLPGVAALVALVIVPAILLFANAVMRYAPARPREFIGLRNFSAILDDRLFWLALQNTITYSGGVILLTLAVGMTLALCLSRITRGSTLFRTAGLLPWAVPLVVSALMWAWIFDPSVGVFNHLMMSFGLTDSSIFVLSDPRLAMPAVILADAWTRIPFLTIFILAGIDGIPPELYEAARVDGADRIDSFQHLTLPLIRGPLLAGLFLINMFSFRALDVVFMMTQGGPGRATYTLPYYLADQLWLKADFGLGAATGVLYLVMIGGFASIYLHLIRKSRDVWG